MHRWLSIPGVPMLALALLAGCASNEQVADTAVRTNLVQERAHNQMLVLNVLRAYERKPMHFTQVTAVRLPPGWGNSSWSLDIPFGGDSINRYLFGPSFTVQQSVDTAVLNTQEFMRGVTSPVPASLMLYFLDQGWPQQLVLHLFVRAIEFYEDDQAAPVERVTNYPEGRAEFERFQQVLGALRRCELAPKPEFDHVFYSDILRADELRQLPSLAAAKSAGLVPVPVDQTGKATSDEKQQAGFRFASVSQTLGFELTDRPGKAERCEGLSAPSSASPIKTLRLQTESRADKARGRSVKFLLRSPEAMIYYLGEIVRAQLQGQLIDGSNERVRPPRGFPSLAPLSSAEGKNEPVPAETLFELREGVSADAALTVEYEGRTYSIARSNTRNRSMHVLWLLSQILALQNKATELPSTANIRLVP